MILTRAATILIITMGKVMTATATDAEGIGIIDALPAERNADQVNSMMKAFPGTGPEDTVISFSWPFHSGW